MLKKLILNTLNKVIPNTLNKLVPNTLCIFLSVCFITGCTEEEVKEKMKDDLDVIKSTFNTSYAPAAWKREHNNWDLDDKIDEAKYAIDTTSDITLKDYHRILLNFFNSTTDYHTGISFHSTEFSILPFRVKSAEGKYIVAWATSKYVFNLSTNPQIGPNPIKAGDEIVKLNGKPIADVIAEFKRENFGPDNTVTDQALAEAYLTLRDGSAGHIVPEGELLITVIPKGGKSEKTYTLDWLHFPELIDPTLLPVLTDLAPKSPFDEKSYAHTAGKKLCEHPFFYKDMSTPFYAKFSKANQKAKLALKDFFGETNLNTNVQANDSDDDGIVFDDEFIGYQNSHIPTLGPVLWRASVNSSFDAYIYKAPNGKKVGFIRIPHFMGSAYMVNEFADIIQIFEKKADAIVIDQLDNPGGNLFYMYGLAAVLSDKPLYVPPQQMAITQSDVSFAIYNLFEIEDIQTEDDLIDEMGDNLYGYFIDLSFVRNLEKYLYFIINQWNEGKRMTDLTHIFGIDFLQNHPKVKCTKPILILVNQLDFSCGDFFPSILQDNDRAVVFGTKTAGAGGFVLGHAYPNLFAIEHFTYTGSLARRPDMNPIENLGITPNVPVDLTVKDLQQNYSDYVQQIHKAVADL